VDATVIVVGAGSAGLMLAGELRMAGADVMVLDRLAEPSGESIGLGLTVRTMEIFDQRGLLPRFGEFETTRQGYFGGMPLDLGSLDGRHQATKTIRQARMEAVLAEWATELGADIRRGHEVLSVTPHAEAVDVEVRGPAGVRRLRSAYLVGCDGRDSIVRREAGFSMPLTAPTREVFVAEVRGASIGSRRGAEVMPEGAVSAYTPEEGIAYLFAHETGARPRRRTGPPEFAEMAAVWQRLTGEDISAASPLWVAALTDEAGQATEYRRGRVLLAGRAAHVQVGAGGWGMHAGMQDGVNLGWKLGAVVRGTAPERLLDTYHTERHPVGRRLLTYVGAHAQLVFHGDESGPLRDLLAELVDYEDVNRHLAGWISGLDVRYDVGPGNHPLLGYRMPEQELVHGDDKTSTTELLRAGHGVLVDCADDAALRALAAPWADRVDIVTAAPHGGPDAPLAGTDAVLVRPDGHVAWATGGRDDLTAALVRWFGAA
jgi:bifunctional hydroxylase/dehydrase